MLHGKWIDATQDTSTIWDEINEVLKTSPIEDAEEWAIHDYDDFENLRVTSHGIVRETGAGANTIKSTNIRNMK